MDQLLIIFLGLRIFQYAIERFLAQLNRNYYLDAARQQHACQVLEIQQDDLEKTIAYTTDKFRFSRWASLINLGITLVFLAQGGLGWFESWAS